MVEPHYYNRNMLWRYLLSGPVGWVFIQCLGWALMSGALASLLALHSEKDDPDGADPLRKSLAVLLD